MLCQSHRLPISRHLPYSWGLPCNEEAARSVIASNGVPFLQMRLVGSHSTSGGEKERSGFKYMLLITYGTVCYTEFTWGFQTLFLLIVLMGCSLLANALLPFKIHCASPNLGIRTWICRLNFAPRSIFSGYRFFNEPEISDLGPMALSPSWRIRIFTSSKNQSTSAEFEPTNLGSRI